MKDKDDRERRRRQERTRVAVVDIGDGWGFTLTIIPDSGQRTADSGDVAKYDALRDYLRGLPAGQRRVTFGFRRLEELLGEPLPPSASKYEAWWLGGRAPVGPARTWQDQVQEQAWRAAGWAVEEVDLLLKNVTLRRLAGY